MLRRLSLLAGLILLVSITAHAQDAQDKVEEFGGYSYMRINTSPSFNSNGWELSGNYKFADWLGAVADIDGHYGSVFGGAGVSQHSFLFGPQISWPTRISPFAHLLIGGSHFSGAGSSDTSFATALGGGIDARLLPSVYWRVIQGDYVATHFFGSTQNDVRVSTGIVVRF